MSKLTALAICCLGLSVWAIIQLSLLSVFFGIQAATLVEDAEVHSHKGYDDFVQKTEKNYAILAKNCRYAALVYVVVLVLSVLLLVYKNIEAKAKALLEQDEDLLCQPKQPPKKCFQRNKKPKPVSQFEYK